MGQPLAVLGQLEDAAVIDPLALEHAAGIVQRMGQYVHLDVPPRRHRAVHPDEAVAVIIRDEGHETLPFPIGCAKRQRVASSAHECQRDRAEGRPRACRLAAPNPLFLRDEELTRGIELLEAAYRRAAGAEPDRVLSGLGLGRNHGGSCTCVGRQPGITMVELQDSVQLTKQTVSRLLKELVGQGPDRRAAEPARPAPAPARADRARAASSTSSSTARLRRQLASAYRAAGAEAVAGYHKVLLGLVDEHARRQSDGAG